MEERTISQVLDAAAVGELLEELLSVGREDLNVAAFEQLGTHLVIEANGVCAPGPSPPPSANCGQQAADMFVPQPIACPISL